EKQVNVFALPRQDAIQLSAEGDRGDAVLFPIVGVLSVADFSAPLSVEGISENRLEFCLRQGIAQETLVEETVLPFSMFDNEADGGPGSNGAKTTGSLCAEPGGNTSP